MAYGHSIRAFIEDGPVEQVAKADARAFDRPRLACARRGPPARLVERALCAANDRIDGFPLAL